MTAKLLDGKTIAQKIREHLAHQLQCFMRHGAAAPGLAVILIGDDPASQIYVRNKREACTQIGIRSIALDLPKNTSTSTLLARIRELNEDTRIQGILIQLPLPEQIDAPLILESIHPDKDVDGFHPRNLGLLAQGRPYLRPCTPYGVMRLLEHEHIPLRGLDAVVVGTSNIVGKPMALELLNAGCTITVCHSATRHLERCVQQAQLLVTAIGQPGIIKSEWIKPGAVVIDIGITRSASGHLYGDIAFETAKQIAAYITPVPGGVGPMTVAMLLENTLLAAEKINHRLDHTG